MGTRTLQVFNLVGVLHEGALHDGPTTMGDVGKYYQRECEDMIYEINQVASPCAESSALSYKEWLGV